VVAGFAVVGVKGYGVEDDHVYVELEGFWDDDEQASTVRLVLWDNREDIERFVDEFVRVVDAALQALGKVKEAGSRG